MRSLSLGLLLGVCATFTVAQARPRVVTTHTVLADLVSVIADDSVEAKCLLPINLDPHSYEPRPADVRLLAQADLVVINGLGLEPWSEKLIANSGFQGPIVIAAEGVPHVLSLDRGERGNSTAYPAQHYDPHAWHNPRNVVHYVASIRDGLTRVLPENAALFAANAKVYSEKLDELDRYAREQFSSLPADHRKLITSHDSLRYLGEAYGLQIVPVAGTRPDQEPSARQLADLITFVRGEHVRAVFFEATSSSKLADLVAREAGVTVVRQLYTDSLGPAGSPGATYLGMMRFNVDTIVASLK